MEGLQHMSVAHSFAAIVIPLNSTAWPYTHIAKLAVRGDTYLSNSYQAELLAAAVASELASPTNPIHIVTDCKSIVQQVTTTRENLGHLIRRND
jgi:hypothetical protein